jgi:hypothetical protein
MIWDGKAGRVLTDQEVRTLGIASTRAKNTESGKVIEISGTP